MNPHDKDEDAIFALNKVLYVIMAVAILVVALDLFKWRPL